MTAFWDIAPRNLLEVDRRFRSAYCLSGDEHTLLPPVEVVLYRASYIAHKLSRLHKPDRAG
jgi:hypothetical protein